MPRWQASWPVSEAMRVALAACWRPRRPSLPLNTVGSYRQIGPIATSTFRWAVMSLAAHNSLSRAPSVSALRLWTFHYADRLDSFRGIRTEYAR
jgi:hypothetical protein